MAVFRGLFVRKDSTRGTQPAEARKALAGLLVPSSATGARQGILAGPGDPLKVTGTAGWTYQVNGGPLVSSRSDADGAVIFGADGPTPTPTVAAAPGSGARWDLIYLRHEDVDKGGGETSAATLGVVSGVASGTPVKPTLPAGAVLVAEALVAAGATSTSHANVTITQKLPLTVARGGIVPAATEAAQLALAGYAGLPVYRTNQGLLYVHNGTGHEILTGQSLGRAEDPSLRASITTEYAVPNCSVTFTLLTAQDVRFEVSANLTAGTGFILEVGIGATRYRIAQDNNASGDRQVSGLRRVSLGAGSHTAQLYARTISGNLAINGGVVPTYLAVDAA